MEGSASKSPLAPGHRYRLGDLILDIDRRRLTRDGRRLTLGNLTFELLRALAAAAPAILTKDELMDRVWAGRVVSPETVSQRVKLLREALDDDAHRPRYIEVLRGQGYRLIPSVEILPTEPDARPRQRWLSPLLATGLGLLAGVGVLLSVTDQPGMVPNSVAVLPFGNLSPDPEYADFAAGIHNELLARLAGIASLKVISRNSVLEYEHTPRDMRAIGQELGVATILEGSVQRDGDEVKINVQLTDVTTNQYVWIEVYDRQLTARNLFEIQSAIATSIAETLEATLSPVEIARLDEMPTEDLRAYEFYLSGNAFEDRGSDFVNVRVRQYELAVARDPKFAHAWAGLTDALGDIYRGQDPAQTRELREKAFRAAETALALDPELPEAHIAMGIYLAGEGDHAGALQQYAMAERAMPSNAWVYKQRAFALADMGELEQAVAEFDRALELDPKDVHAIQQQGVIYTRLRQYERAERAFDRVLELAPDYRQANGWHVLLYQVRGDIERMKVAIEEVSFLSDPPEKRWWVAFYEGEYERAVRHLDDWRVPADDKARAYGLTYRFLVDEPALARKHFEAARSNAERRLDDRPNDFRAMAALAELVGYLGDRERASALARNALELLPDDPLSGHWGHLDIIWALIAAKEHELAIERLDVYLSSPGVWSIEGLERDPRLHVVRTNPRYEAVVGKYRL